MEKDSCQISLLLFTAVYFTSILDFHPENVTITGDGILSGELLVPENDPSTLTCIPSTASLFANNANTNSTILQTDEAQRNQGGFYQCLSSTMALVGSVDTVYVVITCK